MATAKVSVRVKNSQEEEKEEVMPVSGPAVIDLRPPVSAEPPLPQEPAPTYGSRYSDRANGRDYDDDSSMNSGL